MKKFLICCLATVLSASILISCSSQNSNANKNTSSTPVKENSESKETENNNIIDTIKTKFIENQYIPMPIERPENELKELYFSNIDNTKFEDVVDDYTLVETGRSPGIGFTLILKAKPGKIEDAKKIVQSVLDKKIGNAFYPDEKEIAENSKVEVNGDFISLLILDDSIREEATNLYKELIK